MAHEDDLIHLYQERGARFAAEQTRHAARSRWYARARLLAVVAGAGALAWALAGEPAGRAWLASLGGLLIAVFPVLVARHARVEREHALSHMLARLNEEATARVRRDWHQLPREANEAPAGHPYAEDLDLFGRASVMQLLSPSLHWGRQTLARWLLEGASPAAMTARQEASAELAPRLELRQILSARGRLAEGGSSQEIEHFVSWAEAGPWLSRRPWLVWSSRVLGGGTVALVMLHVSGRIDQALWAWPLVVNLALTAAFQAGIHARLQRAGVADRAFRHHADALELAAGETFSSRLLRQLHQRIAPGGVPAHAHMRRLDALNGLANLRLSAAILHFPIQLLTLWDFHVLFLLERWQRAVGRHVRGWFTALGELDALCSLAGLRHDNPSWSVPELTAEPHVSAEGLGHPLIPAHHRVDNDVTLGPPGTFLLVTGSNMSGKSTLLRAIGVNLVLAQAGSVVCATRLRLPLVDLQTSMRVHDSLEEGVSYFMAAVKRLGAIVRQARPPVAEGRLLVYLLDEVLQGTNTAERQVATRTVVRHLLEAGAIGAITTHDLGLAESPDLAPACHPVHFTETIHPESADRPMTFDYRLRPGLATSRNALRLMHLMGLNPDA